MSKENSKRLYDHYVEIGYDKAAKDLLLKYPEFKEEPKEEPKTEKSKKKKGV